MESRLDSICGLTVLIFKESNGDKEMWVCQGLQKDIAVQGNTIEDAKERFEQIMKAWELIIQEKGLEGYNKISRAPEHYWKKAGLSPN